MLQNGWTDAPFATRNAAVANVNGIVQFEGAIATTGTNPVPFTLPSAFRPSKPVFVPVDLCNATNGRLQIEPNGTVTVQAEAGAFSNAACFTSLDGVSYPLAASGFTALTLQNGWTNGPVGTRNAAAMAINGVVHFEGALATSGTNPVPFTLPSAFRPSKPVFVPVDLCNATNGRLQIEPNGTVTVEAQGGAFSNAACFTSLEGVSYPLTASGFTALPLQNGWTGAPFGTRGAAVANINGIVRLEGAIATTGTNPVSFTLPTAFRPSKAVYVKVDLCNGTNGVLLIQPNGTVTVQAEGGAFSNAACFTSLEGASYPLTASIFTALTLQNGWTDGPFATRNAAVAKVNGIVQFEGAIATSGTNPVPFTLPSAFRPPKAVYVKVDLCSGTNGVLFIQPNGTVTVEAGGGAFSNAACFTSLEGASYPLTATSFTVLPLQNGWFTAPFNNRDAAAASLNGIVHFEGAIATSGTNPVPFTLPSAFRPSSAVFVPVDECTTTNGRLQIEPTGTVTVQAEGGAFSNAACFTSLEGVTYALTASGFTALPLQNGWTNAPFSTRTAAVTSTNGIVHFEGAIATTGTNPVPFTLPSAFRPSTAVFVPVDLCNATNGQLQIQPTGAVTVEPQGGTFSNAQCFTGLDGVTFAR